MPIKRGEYTYAIVTDKDGKIIRDYMIDYLEKKIVEIYYNLRKPVFKVVLKI